MSVDSYELNPGGWTGEAVIVNAMSNGSSHQNVEDGRECESCEIIDVKQDFAHSIVSKMPSYWYSPAVEDWQSRVAESHYY